MWLGAEERACLVTGCATRAVLGLRPGQQPPNDTYIPCSLQTSNHCDAARRLQTVSLVNHPAVRALEAAR